VIVDGHCHPLEGPGLQGLLRLMREAGVERAVLFPPALEPLPEETGRPPDGWSRTASLWPSAVTSVNWLARRCYQRLAQTKGRLRLGARWYRVLSGPDNAPVAAAVSAHPDRFVGFAYVNPAEPDHLDTALSFLGAGFKGVQVNAWLDRFDVAQDLYPLARLCGERGYPVHIQLGGTRRTGWSLVELADRLPGTNFIIAHAGLPYGPSIWRAARTRPNLYFDLAPPFVDEGLLELVARRVPPGRLIFASGGAAGLRTPEGDYSYRDLMARMRNLPLVGRAVKAVMGENLWRLLEAGPLERELRARLWAYASGSPGGR